MMITMVHYESNRAIRVSAAFAPRSARAAASADDQVDALSLAFNELAARPPMRINPDELRKIGIDPDRPSFRRNPFGPTGYDIARGFGW